MLISICIPTYNRLNYLQEAVNSALNQSYTNIEVIIGQDPTPNGLDKNIENWALEIVQKDNRVVYFANSSNLGLGGNWNACLNKATGSYYVMIGDDDRLLPNFIEKLSEGIQHKADVIFCNQYLINSNGDRLNQESIDFNIKYKRNVLKQGLLNNIEKSIWENSIPASAALVNTKIAKQLQYKSDLNTPEIELYLRMNQANAKFYFTPECLMEFRIHQHSSTSSGLMQEKLIKYLLKIPISPKNIAIRNHFISRISASSINNLILTNHKKEAKDLLRLLKKNNIHNNKLFILTILITILPLSIFKFLIKQKRNL